MATSPALAALPRPSLSPIARVHTLPGQGGCVALARPCLWRVTWQNASALAMLPRSPISPLAAHMAWRPHTRDTDCRVGLGNECGACGAFHGDPCVTCGGRGFHCAPCVDCEGLCECAGRSAPWGAGFASAGL